MFFKRLSSRHIHKEIKLLEFMNGFDNILCETDLNLILRLTNKCSTFHNVHFEACLMSINVPLWYSIKVCFERGGFLLCSDPYFDGLLSELNTPHNLLLFFCIFSRQTSLARQDFLITPLHGARYKTGKTLTPKSSAMKSYLKSMRHPQHWYFPQFRCNMRKISAKRYRRAKLVLLSTNSPTAVAYMWSWQHQSLPIIKSHWHFIFMKITKSWLVGWLCFTSYWQRGHLETAPPIYCPLRRTWSSVNTPYPPGIEPRAVAWLSITLPLRHASSLNHQETVFQNYRKIHKTVLICLLCSIHNVLKRKIDNWWNISWKPRQPKRLKNTIKVNYATWN